jgi:5-methylcytosine-specific restriction endonuclease McrA
MQYPKQPKPLKKTSQAWRERVNELYNREQGHCQVCRKWLDRNEAAPHHKRSQGSGGSDELDNLMLLCKECHVKIHTGEIMTRTLLK